jgi:putative membrane protein
MKRLAMTTLVAMLLATGGLPALALDDPAFAVAAVSANLLEIQIGQLAQQRGQNAQVKALGDTLVNDHTASHQKATALAAKLEQYAPTVLPGDQARVVATLSSLSGADFDRRFVDEVINAHNAAIQLYSPSTTSGNAEVKAFATESMRMFQTHLAAAQALKGQLR